MLISILRTDTEKAKFTVVYALPFWSENSRKQRGWHNAKVIYERKATDEEEEEAKQRYRMISYLYTNWEEVVKDEALYGIDANAEIAKNYDYLDEDLIKRRIQQLTR